MIFVLPYESFKLAFELVLNCIYASALAADAHEQSNAHSCPIFVAGFMYPIFGTLLRLVYWESESHIASLLVGANTHSPPECTLTIVNVTHTPKKLVLNPLDPVYF